MRFTRSRSILRSWAHVAAASFLLTAFAAGFTSGTATLFQGTFDESTGSIAADIGTIQISGSSGIQIATAPDGGKLVQMKGNSSEKVTMNCKFSNDVTVMSGTLTISYEAILATRDCPFDLGIHLDAPCSDTIPATGSDSWNHLVVAGKTTGVTLPPGVPIQINIVCARANPAFDWSYVAWAQVLSSNPNTQTATIPYSGTLQNTANSPISSFRFEKKSGTTGTLGLDDIYAAGPPQ